MPATFWPSNPKHEQRTAAVHFCGRLLPFWPEPNALVVLADGAVDEVGRAASGDERDRLWDRWRKLDPQLDGWAALRPTETAVVVLTPVKKS